MTYTTAACRQGRRTAIAAATATITAVLLLIGPPRADAGLLSDGSCPSTESSQVFARWLDLFNYSLVPGGSFEDGAAGWQLENGASVVPGNESFQVGGREDSQSLALPRGSSATSPTTCVGLTRPTIRFFARNTGSFLGTLKVEVLFEGGHGNVNSITIGRVLAGKRWQPTLPMVVLINLLPVLPGDQSQVAFRFTADGGNWQIDDLYVDPFRKR
jgi:hypothetical protein